MGGQQNALSQRAAVVQAPAALPCSINASVRHAVSRSPRITAAIPPTTTTAVQAARCEGQQHGRGEDTALRKPQQALAASRAHRRRLCRLLQTSIMVMTAARAHTPHTTHTPTFSVSLGDMVERLSLVGAHRRRHMQAGKTVAWLHIMWQSSVGQKSLRAGGGITSCL